MKVLVTGANGFLGKNLVAELRNIDIEEIFEYTRDSTEEELQRYTKYCDFVFHLAGVNRPKNNDEFIKGNSDLTEEIISQLVKNNNLAPIVLSSSTQAENDNPYGHSKKTSEDLVKKYGADYNVKTYIYRLPNLFGKWSKPYYNSVIATFCHNIARGMKITVNDPTVNLTLCYVDDVLDEFKAALKDEAHFENEHPVVEVRYEKKLGEIADLIKSFKDSRNNRYVPNMGDDFTKKLYSTYLSYLPEEDFSYDLTMHKDERGSFTEFIRTINSGQVSVNVSKPGIAKGDHWHHTKNEKFLVVSGEGVIKFRKYGTKKVIEYKVTGDKLEVVDIPTGYTHSIINTGTTDLVTVMWANECFDPNNPDTYYLEV